MGARRYCYRASNLLGLADAHVSPDFLLPLPPRIRDGRGDTREPGADGVEGHDLAAHHLDHLLGEDTHVLGRSLD